VGPLLAPSGALSEPRRGPTPNSAGGPLRAPQRALGVAATLGMVRVDPWLVTLPSGPRARDPRPAASDPTAVPARGRCIQYVSRGSDPSLWTLGRPECGHALIQGPPSHSFGIRRYFPISGSQQLHTFGDSFLALPAHSRGLGSARWRMCCRSMMGVHPSRPRAGPCIAAAAVTAIIAIAGSVLALDMLASSRCLWFPSIGPLSRVWLAIWGPPPPLLGHWH
jgi:hypothetical protein